MKPLYYQPILIAVYIINSTMNFVNYALLDDWTWLFFPIIFLLLTILFMNIDRFKRWQRRRELRH
ncbi:hypothetical protein COT97_02005 [Candidatus Falkowbacteria bacterium CG10_big_fil_rev_8_21_14_0_10_39_11]|uniref:Uncharacterized protein n=1 Tax=Candidatus Falkowbacteria bacterium CG10_big_fil_rev_8_21_14_0_10_39_11 TaxID=1974565 RepID=A0A2H0V555_9BACT|nr:MAG: hypothetical protein COT97_02005 [Candidatus Falkowbacteria bacterium CG10_big_fil_rev_8_21_14_0_10_39_11]